MPNRWNRRLKEHTARYQTACKSYSGSDYERATYPDDLLYHFSFWQEIKPNPFNDHPIKFCADDYAEIYHSPQFQRIGGSSIAYSLCISPESSQNTWDFTAKTRSWSKCTD